MSAGWANRDDPQWLIDPFAAVPTSASAAFAVRPVPALQALPRHEGWLVLGTCGGSGSTITTLGLGAAIAGDEEVVAVDATCGGGDLTERGADEWWRPVTAQDWISREISRHWLSDSVSRASSGLTLLGNRGASFGAGRGYRTVRDELDNLAHIAIFDGGGVLHAPHLHPLYADATLSVVMTVAARADQANKLRDRLRWLRDFMSEEFVQRVSIAVTHQSPYDDPHGRIADHLRVHLDGCVRKITEVPYEPQLALGGIVTVDDWQPQTRDAFSGLVDLDGAEAAASDLAGVAG